MNAHISHFPGRPTTTRYVPPDCPPCDVEPRLVDEGTWEPVSNRFLSYGFVMFLLGVAFAWALMWART